MKKRVLMVVLSTMILIGMSGCMEAEKNADIIVTIGKQNIKCITLKKTENGSSNDKMDTFKYAFEQTISTDIKYIKIGEKVVLDFGNNPPDKITIKDSLLNSRGEIMYTDKETIPLKFHLQKKITNIALWLKSTGHLV